MYQSRILTVHGTFVLKMALKKTFSSENSANRSVEKNQ